MARRGHWHPAVEDIPGVTYTANGIPGDPLNVALVGTEGQIDAAMLAAKWFPADRITLRSSLRIAADTVFHRSYDDAPVSSLYLWGRKEDLAFEQPVAPTPDNDITSVSGGPKKSTSKAGRSGRDRPPSTSAWALVIRRAKSPITLPPPSTRNGIT